MTATFVGTAQAPNPERLLLAMDPGTVSCGVALFAEGVLTRAALLQSDDKHLPTRILTIGSQLQDFIGNDKITRFVSEVPVKYPHDTVRPNDLIKLAIVVGVGIMAAAGSSEQMPELYEPAQWKGQMNKTKVTNLVRLSLTSLEKRVLEALKWDHNVVEAVGIGLFHLKRGWRK